MAYLIKGKVEAIMPTKATTTKEGKSLYTREIAIKTYRFNPETGEPELSSWNIPKFEAREESCKLLDTLKVGDDVKIMFSVSGASYKDKTTNEQKYFTSLRIVKIEKEMLSLGTEEISVSQNTTQHLPPTQHQNFGNIPFDERPF